ncbi:hypothetical protein Tco_1566406, partial [Tanacetum coccineum]
MENRQGIGCFTGVSPVAVAKGVDVQRLGRGVAAGVMSVWWFRRWYRGDGSVVMMAEGWNGVGCGMVAAEMVMK